MDRAAIIQVKPMVDYIDSAVVDKVDEFMCKKECPCDSAGIQFLNQWSSEIQNEFMNPDLYKFDGEITNFYECYQKLVQDGNIPEDQKIKDRDL